MVAPISSHGEGSSAYHHRFCRVSFNLFEKGVAGEDYAQWDRARHQLNGGQLSSYRKLSILKIARLCMIIPHPILLDTTTLLIHR